MPPIQWTLEKIRSGFNEFYKSQDRYPTALEIDQFKFLPSSRQIQRKFGGLKKLKEVLGLPIDTQDFGKGLHRSNIARIIGVRGKSFERNIYSILVAKFGEMFVHAQKPFNDYDNRIDFFIFCKDYKFGIDVFYPDNLHNLRGCVNLKQKTYKNLNFDVIFLSTNPSISQIIIDNYLINRKIPLTHNIKVYTLEKFELFISGLKPLKI